MTERTSGAGAVCYARKRHWLVGPQRGYVIRTALQLVMSHGPLTAARAIGQRLFRLPYPSFSKCAPYFADKECLDVGGPSARFEASNVFPVYGIASRVDYCNYADGTIWHAPGQQSRGTGVPGKFYFCEATCLTGIESERYDCVLSSHTLEHSANPLKVLAEAKRVLKLSGLLLLILPHKDDTFDRYRPTTALSHLISDYEQDVGEDDLTHLPEILNLHDFSRDRATRDELKARAMENRIYRSLHHHVFDTKLVWELLDREGMQILFIEYGLPADIIVIAQKIANRPDNRKLLQSIPVSSPFPSDRTGSA